MKKSKHFLLVFSLNLQYTIKRVVFILEFFMHWIRNILVFLLILSCLWIGSLIIRKAFQSNDVCLSEKITTAHPDYVRCGPQVQQHLLSKANAGDAQAMYKLALMYDIGDRITGDRKQAIYWMQKAENANLADAQYGMAVWAERGYYGDEGKDLIIPLYTAAANQGHLNAMKSLANIYRTTNKGKSQYWMERIQKAQ